MDILNAQQDVSGSNGGTSDKENVIVEENTPDKSEENVVALVSDVSRIALTDSDDESKIPPVVSLLPAVTSVPESLNARIKVADISVTDDDGGDNRLSLSGKDASWFALENTELFFQGERELDFDEQSEFMVSVLVDDPTIGLGAESNVEFTLTVEEPLSAAISVEGNSFKVEGEPGNKFLRLSLESVQADATNDIVLVPTGAVESSEFFNGPQVLFSALAEEGFQGLKLDRTLSIPAGTSFQLFAQGDNGLSSRQGVNTVTTLDDGRVRIEFAFANGSNFGKISLIAQLFESDELSLPLGANLQDGSDSDASKLVDLRGVAGDVTATFEVYREADLDNEVGFFMVEDLTGSVLDGDGNLIGVGDDGYVQAAMERRVDLALTTGNGAVSTYSSRIAGGKLLSSFIVSDGTISELLDSDTANDPTVYFTHLGANSDGANHVRLLGDNTFGFEDMVDGGDKDFDDIIVKARFV